MGLPAAIKAHSQGDLEKASLHYNRALEQGVRDEALFQNYGALLKSQANSDEAEKIYQRGLAIHPKSHAIMRNYANLLRANSKPAASAELYFRVLRILQEDNSFQALNSDKNLRKIFLDTLEDTIQLLNEHDLRHWCTFLIKKVLLCVDHLSPVLLKNLILLSSNDDPSCQDSAATETIKSLSYELAQLSSVKDAALLDFILADHYLQSRDGVHASEYYMAGIKKIQRNFSDVDQESQSEVQKLVDCNGWNLACTLLPLQRFSEAWSYFDHGLRTPAQGKQRWQRALVKPFSSSLIPLWRGENGSNKRLLLLEEQAIGDGMMFISLLPALLAEFQFIGLYISPRLEKIYKRSFELEIKNNRIQIYTKENLEDGLLKSSNFDYQSPLGSICQYRFNDISSFAPRVPILSADQNITNQLRTEYLRSSPSSDLLVGISWKGGGRGKRITEKSLDPNLFYELLSPFKNIKFIDLQYGNTKDQISTWKKQNLDVIHDPRIDPLKDMDLWLSQVNACDAVLSVANTTIHGAGGLNLPTNCLLSVYSDWRWLSDHSVKRSYWYPSVGISRQDPDLSWDTAFTSVQSWLEDGCPYIAGPNCSSVL